MREKFLSCYDEVFNEDGTQKNCGREKCIQLIKIAEELCPYTEADNFGSTKTGFINEKEIRKLYVRVYTD